MHSDQRKIEERCKGTSRAREVLEIIHGEGEELEASPEAWKSYWEKIFSEVVENVDVEPQVLDVHPMSREEVKSFSKQRMTFGKHKGDLIGSVDLSYLLWIDDQSDFRRELKRYLASDAIQEVQGCLFEDGDFI